MWTVKLGWVGVPGISPADVPQRKWLHRWAVGYFFGQQSGKDAMMLLPIQFCGCSFHYLVAGSAAMRMGDGRWQGSAQKISWASL
jgi:hypothetical protein